MKLFKRALLIAAALLVCAHAQQYDPISTSITGSITTAGSGCDGFTCVWIHLPQNTATATVQLTGTWTATVQFEASVNSTAWSPIASSGGPTSATGAGIYSFNLNGLLYLRVRASALSAGPIPVAITSSMSGGGGGGGGGGSGTVTSVGLSMPSGFTVSGSPVTAAGTLSVTTSSSQSAGFPAGITTGDGTKTGVQCFNGVTSGQVCLSVADVAGTAIVYLWPSSNGTAGQFLKDNGSVTCPTLPATTPALPSTCHQMVWATAATTGLVFGTNPPARTNAVTNVPATNSTRAYGFYFPGPTVPTLSTVYLQVTTVDNSANVYDVGFYGPGCNAGATNVPLIAHSGPIPGSTFGAATGTIAITMTGAPVTVNAGPGWYCFVITTSASTPLLILGGENAGSTFAAFANGAVVGSTTSGTLNSTITAPAAAYGYVSAPIIKGI